MPIRKTLGAMAWGNGGQRPGLNRVFRDKESVPRRLRHATVQDSKEITKNDYIYLSHTLKEYSWRLSCAHSKIWENWTILLRVRRKNERCSEVANTKQRSFLRISSNIICSLHPIINYFLVITSFPLNLIRFPLIIIFQSTHSLLQGFLRSLRILLGS